MKKTIRWVVLSSLIIFAGVVAAQFLSCNTEKKGVIISLNHPGTSLEAVLDEIIEDTGANSVKVVSLMAVSGINLSVGETGISYGRYTEKRTIAVSCYDRHGNYMKPVIDSKNYTLSQN